MISTHFDRSEFACKCGCGFDTVDIELIDVLERVRSFFNAPVTINSACRCPAHNESVGGSPKSQHLFGRAADIVVSGVNPTTVYSYINGRHPNEFGLGSYDTFTHIDSRSDGPARW